MFAALSLALGFLTRISVVVSAPQPVHFSRALFWFPFVGVVLAALLSGVLWGSSWVLGPTVAAALTLAAWAWVTGGLHADGLADTVDGLSASHRDAQRGLDVMRDPNIGAHGALSLVVVYVLKFALLVNLAQHAQGTGLALVAALVAALCASIAGARFWVAQVVLVFPSARKDGMGARFRVAPRRELALLGIAPWVAIALLLAWYDTRLLLLQAASFVCMGALMLALAWRWSKSFGGLTGDLYGALIELGETCSLLVWLLLCSPLLTGSVYGNS